jgi:hypothetical protein
MNLSNDSMTTSRLLLAPFLYRTQIIENTIYSLKGYKKKLK